ncbi:MAG: GNAT family N-acetyltransferase [Muribaculaceae bacterium]|nr:GNAT family N-acetyltransferase [Muribaculaceae bacterium]
METKNLKLQLEKLWKETFGDTDSYIRLIFDNYFRPERVAYIEDGGVVVSALLSVPYEFKPIGDNRQSLKGLYLCGLSTSPSRRHQGLMNSLLEQINRQAMKEDFDFTFLIPASDGLARYYEDRGYMPAFYYREENYVPDHNFNVYLTKSHIYKEEDKKRYFEKLNADVVNLEISELTDSIHSSSERVKEILNFLLNFKPIPGNETGEEVSYIIGHSTQDWIIVLKELLISKGLLYICKEEGVIRGVAFASEEKEIVRVKKIISDNALVDIKLRDFIKKSFPKKNLRVISYVNERSNDFENDPQLWQPFYIHNNAPDAEYEDVSNLETAVLPQNRTKPFGMCRILDASEILKKLANRSDASKFSILANEGKVLLRRPGSPDYIGKELGIPLLDLSAFLLLE